jgi:hypothetical protein
VNDEVTEDVQPIVWTRDEALAFLMLLEPLVLAAGYGVGLTGSVLFAGESRNDLDIIIFPQSKGTENISKLYEALELAGMFRRCGRGTVVREWEKVGSTDLKNVEVWRTAQRRRVDIFFLS